MIGQLINKFDNSDGTIKSFNYLFSTHPIEGTGTVEILRIVGVGKELIREILVNGNSVIYDFEKTIHKRMKKQSRGVKKGKRTYNGGDLTKYYYYIKNNNTNEEFSLKTAKDISNLIKISQVAISRRFSDNCCFIYDKYSIQRQLKRSK